MMGTTTKKSDRFRMASGSGVRTGNQGQKNVRNRSRRSTAMSQTRMPARAGGLKGPMNFKA